MKKRGKCNQRFFDKQNQKAQIWVETVLYTLIAFVMIGLVLAYARPKIEELQDKAIIEQSIEMIKQIDSLILTIGAPGNKRLIEVGINKGNLKIDGENNLIEFEIETDYVYSEIGSNIEDGNLLISTSENKIVTIKRDYSEEYDLTFQDQDEAKVLSKSSTSYQVYISNKGGELSQIDFEVK